MRPEQLDEALASIDAVVGPPETETDEEHEQRRKMIERDARARQIRKG